MLDVNNVSLTLLFTFTYNYQNRNVNTEPKQDTHHIYFNTTKTIPSIYQAPVAPCLVVSASAQQSPGGAVEFQFYLLLVLRQQQNNRDKENDNSQCNVTREHAEDVNYRMLHSHS